MKFEVKNRWRNEVQFVAEIDAEEDCAYSIKLGLAIKWGLNNGADLRDADLSGATLSRANLRDATLSGADLSGADLNGATLRDATLSLANLRDATLRGADLSGATLCRANLRDATLSGADLRDATLSGADLIGADLSRADLRDADLSGADLRDADLNGADLRDADLSGANLRLFKHDFWGILLLFKHELPELIKYIKGGKINGSVYSGDCSCLMGTIAAIKKCDIDSDEKFSIKDALSPAERWFMMIKPGDTPENNFASKMALEWAEEFMVRIGDDKLDV